MASKLSFLTLFMEKKKTPKHNTNTNTNNNINDLSFVKAAAWAWYQHNSGSKGKPITEFDATITHRAPRPSRYKLEAMRMAQEQARQESSIHSKKFSLLDEYEVQSISKQLNGLVESSSNGNSNIDIKVVNGADNSTNKRVQKKKVKKRSWLRHGAVCGREGDVVDPSCLRVGRSAKQVPTVNGAL